MLFLPDEVGQGDGDDKHGLKFNSDDCPTPTTIRTNRNVTGSWTSAMSWAASGNSDVDQMAVAWNKSQGEPQCAHPPPAGPVYDQSGKIVEVGGCRMVVKNTFLELAEDEPQTEILKETCPVRFSSPASLQTWTNQQSIEVKSEHADIPADSKCPNSIGSVNHGLLSETGEPECQPCAWFWKESGCYHGKGCRYCHKCPVGELKHRKKKKVARLRALDQEKLAGTKVTDTTMTIEMTKSKSA